MQAPTKMIVFAAFVLTYTRCSARPDLGSPGEFFFRTPGIHSHLKHNLQKWTTDSSSTSRKLLQGGSQGDSLLQAVKSQGYSEVESLLQAGADPNYTTEDGFDALAVAIINDKGSIVTLLIDYGADWKGAPGSHTSKYGALQICSTYDSTEAAAALLAAGVPVDGIGSTGFAALHDCAIEGAVNLVQLLLDNGATIDLYTNTRDPVTALHIAVVNKHLSIVRLLLNRGANINSAAKNSGDTPLHDAAQEDAALIIQELLDSGADINARDTNGTTPLWDAALLGNKSALEVLVSNGADKSIKGFDLTPREALCGCLVLDNVPKQCQSEECKNPVRMQQLLED